MRNKKRCVNIFSILINERDPLIDTVLGGLSDSGIESVEVQPGFFKKVVFNNKCSYVFWDTNKYYGWLGYGTFYDEYGNRRWSYKDLRPSRKMMNRFYLALNEWIEKSVNDKV